MQAITVVGFGDPSVLALTEADDPRPAPGEVLVRVRLTNVNFRDVQERRGSYAAAKAPPFVPGLEASGTIAALGDGVVGFEVGQRVVAFASRGSYATLMPAAAALTYALPDDVADDQVAGLTAAVTAENVLSLPARPVRGRTVVVHSAAGGVGSLALQIARAHGAKRIIGIVGQEAKAEAARAAGADVVIVRAADGATDAGTAAAAAGAGHVEQVLDLTDGVGADLILNSVGGATVDQDLLATAEFGAVVVIGQSSGAPGRVSTDRLHKASRSLIGYSSGHLRQRQPERLREPVARVLGRIADGSLRIPIGARFDLVDAARAHALVEGGGSTGKVLLDVAP
jgi:NADPH:quinone reductase